MSHELSLQSAALVQAHPGSAMAHSVAEFLDRGDPEVLAGITLDKEAEKVFNTLNLIFSECGCGNGLSLFASRCILVFAKCERWYPITMWLLLAFYDEPAESRLYFEVVDLIQEAGIDPTPLFHEVRGQSESGYWHGPYWVNVNSGPNSFARWMLTQPTEWLLDFVVKLLCEYEDMEESGMKSGWWHCDDAYDIKRFGMLLIQSFFDRLEGFLQLLSETIENSSEDVEWKYLPVFVHELMDSDIPAVMPFLRWAHSWFQVRLAKFRFDGETIKKLGIYLESRLT